MKPKKKSMKILKVANKKKFTVSVDNLIADFHFGRSINDKKEHRLTPK